MKTTNKIRDKCKRIRLILTDVDGVLTDGGMYYTEKGEMMKKFNTRDGMAVELSKYDVKTIFVTRENSKIAVKRAQKVKADDVFIKVTKKESLLPIICKKYKVKLEEIAYIGDDINDLVIMKMVGFCATPNDGMGAVKSIAHYICKKNGGQGAFREFADLIILSKI